MIKLGISKLDKLQKGNARTLFRNELKNVSITLYDQIINLPAANELAERILLLFANERGAYKRTYAKRFEDFDQQAFVHICRHFNADHFLTVHDVGVSDGRTACDFFEKLAFCFSNIAFYASDYDPEVFVIENSRIKITLSQNDKLLEIVWPPFVFNTIKRDSYRCYPLNHLIKFFVNRFAVKPLLDKYRLGKIKARKLQLFCPKALILTQKDQRFHLGQYNLMEPAKTPKVSNIVRAMNVLNKSYFTDQEMTHLMGHIFNQLSERGILIIGSNQESSTIVHGGIYQKQSDHFIKLWQSGEGASIDNLILNITYS